MQIFFNVCLNVCYILIKTWLIIPALFDKFKCTSLPTTCSMSHSSMVWEQRNCYCGILKSVPYRQIAKTQTAPQKWPLKPFRLKTAFQRGKKKEVNYKYLIFTAVNHHVTVLFGQVFSSFSLCLWGHESPTSVATACYRHPIQLSDQQKHATYLFLIFHDPLNTAYELHSVNAACFFSVSLSTCCNSFWALLLKDTTFMNYGWTVRS